MNQLLKIGQNVRLEATGLACQVEEYLGGGGQGEVYRAMVGGKPMAVKWYFPYCYREDKTLRARLTEAITKGPPSDRFLWPEAFVIADGADGFGYAMPLREPRFKGMTDLVKRRIEPGFRTLAVVGFELAHSFKVLHAKGLCYRDISFNNIFFDPKTGEVRICDNDNADVEGRPGSVSGTMRFIAPEVVRGEAVPDTATDLFSLSVLLFYMLMVHHPLEGAKEQGIRCFDQPAMRKIYGDEPIFIFDPHNHSNEPVPSYHDNALAFWPIYPQFLRDLFARAFTIGLREPKNGRVREGEWREAMLALRDAVVYCAGCGCENFYDESRPPADPGVCWSCHAPLRLPPRLRIGKLTVLLNHDTVLYPYHLEDQYRFDFTQPVAAMNRHPQNPDRWGLKNLSDRKWTVTRPDGSVREVEPERSVPLAAGLKIDFGRRAGEIVV